MESYEKINIKKSSECYLKCAIRYCYKLADGLESNVTRFSSVDTMFYIVARTIWLDDLQLCAHGPSSPEFRGITVTSRVCVEIFYNTVKVGNV